MWNLWKIHEVHLEPTKPTIWKFSDIIGNSFEANRKCLNQLDNKAKVKLFLSPIISVDYIEIAKYTTETVFYCAPLELATKL